MYIWKTKNFKKDNREEEKFEGIMTENFTILMIDAKPAIHENKRIPNRVSTKMPTAKYIIVNYIKQRQRKNLERSYRNGAGGRIPYILRKKH